MAPGWYTGARMEKWRRGCGRLRKLCVQRNHHHHCVSCSSHSQRLLRTSGPGAPLPLTSKRMCKGLSSFQQAQCLLSSKKGTRSTRHRPQANTANRNCSAQFSGSRTAPRLEHTCSSVCAPKANGQQALSFPPLPCKRPAGRAQPVTSTTLLNSLPPGGEDIRTEESSPQGKDARCPKATSGSHREQELPVPEAGGGARISHPTAVIGAVSSAGLSPAHCLHAMLPMSVPPGGGGAGR